MQQLLTDNLFLLGSSPRPVHVEFALDEGGADGAPVDPSLALQPPPHFAQAQPPPHLLWLCRRRRSSTRCTTLTLTLTLTLTQPGTLEYDFALRWRELTLSQKAEGARLAELQTRTLPSYHPSELQGRTHAQIKGLARS